MSKDIQICFHGTTKENADKILTEGFNVGTYFAKHLEDALEFGGEYVFFVKFEGNGFSGWQFHLRNHLLPDKIWRLIQYSPKLLLETGIVDEYWATISCRK